MLRKPYPRTDNLGQKLITDILVSLFVAVFLLVFKPFGMNQIPGPGLNWQIAGYGLVSFTGIVLVSWLPRLFWKNYFSESRWTVGKQILWVLLIIMVIALGNMLYTYWLGYAQLSLVNAFYFAGFTLAVGFFPIVASILFNYSRLDRSNTNTAQIINSELIEADEQAADAAQNETTTGDTWTFTGENANESLETDAARLLYIESSDNYSTFYWTEAGAVKRKMLRGSLKKMEEQVQWPELFRCHRTFIVNLKKITAVSGNSQGYRLKLAGTDTEVPVARSSGKALQERLRKLKS